MIGSNETQTWINRGRIEMTNEKFMIVSEGSSDEILCSMQHRIDDLEAALTKAQEDINWMLNSEKLLNSFVFDYIDKVLENK